MIGIMLNQAYNYPTVNNCSDFILKLAFSGN